MIFSVEIYFLNQILVINTILMVQVLDSVSYASSEKVKKIVHF
jgi:hypothetical protein